MIENDRSPARPETAMPAYFFLGFLRGIARFLMRSPWTSSMCSSSSYRVSNFAPHFSHSVFIGWVLMYTSRSFVFGLRY